MDAQSLLSQLGSTYGIELVFDERGVCGAAFDADDVDFQLCGTQLCVVAEIGSAQDKRSVIKHFFGLNLSPAKIAGGYFGFDEVYGQILFVRSMPSSMEYDEFENILVASLKTIRESKKELADLVMAQDDDEENGAALRDIQAGADLLRV